MPIVSAIVNFKSLLVPDIVFTLLHNSYRHNVTFFLVLQEHFNAVLFKRNKVLI